MSTKTTLVELNEDEIKNLLFVFQGATLDATLTSMPDLIPKLIEAQAKLKLPSLAQRPVDYLKGQIDAAINAQHPTPGK